MIFALKNIRTKQKVRDALKRWQNRFVGFLWPRESDEWLTVLRIGVGLQVIGYCLSLRRDWLYLFSETQSGALHSRTLSEGLLSLDSPLVPRIGWLISLGAHLGVKEETILFGIWTLLLAAGLGLLAGRFCRPSAIVAWFLHLCAVKSSDLLSYGVDNFMTIGLFYLMISPLPDPYALDARRRSLPPDRSQLSGFLRRVLQIHLCLIYFFSGLTKCLGSGWWNGENLWRVCIRPPFNSISPDLLIHGKALFPIGGIVICLLEIGFPFFIWSRKVGRIWLVDICLMHLMIGFAMGMYLFGLVMITLNLAAFGPPPASEQTAHPIPATG